VVHEAVLAEQSSTLAALIRGEMAESVADESRWTDVDKERLYGLLSSPIQESIRSRRALRLKRLWRQNRHRKSAETGQRLALVVLAQSFRIDPGSG
jgi:hypothetical protein